MPRALYAFLMHAMYTTCPVHFALGHPYTQCFCVRVRLCVLHFAMLSVSTLQAYSIEQNDEW
jgi:hypothetical protein